MFNSGFFITLPIIYVAFIVCSFLNIYFAWVFNHFSAGDKKFDYKLSIVLSCFLLSLIFSLTIARISYITNYFDDSSMVFKNLLFRTKFDDRYYFRIDFNQTLQKDFVANKVFVK